MITHAYSYNDILLKPRYSEVKSRNNISLDTKLTPKITLKIPIVSSNMDTVTESEMAIAMAKNGGLGIIHRYCTVEEQVDMVKKVKRATNYVIEHPFTCQLGTNAEKAEEIMTKNKIGCLLIEDSSNMLKGILTQRDLHKMALFDSSDELKVESIMTHNPVHLIIDSLEKVDYDLLFHMCLERGIENIPLINNEGKIAGLVTLKDLTRFRDGVRGTSRCVLDNKGRLLVGAAVGVHGDYLQRTGALIDSGCDVICIDVAHGHHKLCGDAVKEIKSRFDIEVIAGNVCTAEGVQYLVNAGADSIKVGVGPGCFAGNTQVLMGNRKYKAISDIEIGEYVINREGNSVKVIGKTNQGIRNTINLYHNNWHEATVVTPNHLYLIKDGDGKIDWKPIFDVDISKEQLLFPETNPEFIGIKVTSSTNNFPVTVWDIEVDCPTHSFIANNAIVHNSICVTRKQTGCGYPQFSAVLECSTKARELGVTIIADGGHCGSYGNLVKAIAAGASVCMLGKMLGGTTESPGLPVVRDGQKVKIVRGMAGRLANISRSEKTSDDRDLANMTPEGVEGYVPYKGAVGPVLEQIKGGLRSGLSYQGCSKITELHQLLTDGLLRFSILTSSGIEESNSHGIKML